MSVVVSAAAVASSAAIVVSIVSGLVLLNVRGKLPAQMVLHISGRGTLIGPGSPNALWLFVTTPVGLALSAASMALTAHGRLLPWTHRIGLMIAAGSVIMAVFLNLNIVVVIRAALTRKRPSPQVLRAFHRVVVVFVLTWLFGVAIIMEQGWTHR